MSRPDRILVTGASGFVGAAMVRQLVAQGRQVAVLLRAGSDTRRLHGLLNKITVLRGSLDALSAVQPAIHAFAPEAVAHLAWEGVKGADRNHAVQLKNVVASIETYQIARASGASYFVGLGSQAEYGPRTGRISEDMPTHPTTVYGATKLGTGLMLERLSAASDFAFGWLRLFSTYGPQDDPSWLIPYVTTQLLSGAKPSLTGAEQVWDYLYVDDVAAGVIAAIDARARGIFNLGSGRACPLRDIITMVRDWVDPDLPLGFGEIPYRPDQVMHLEANIDALCQAAAWSPTVSLSDGIAATVAWHRGAPIPPVAAHT